MTDKTHQAMLFHPLFVIHIRLGSHIVGKARPGFLGDQTDFVMAHGYLAAEAVSMGVEPGTGLHLQQAPLFIYRPDPGQGGV